MNNGRPQPKRVANLSAVRGTLTVREEHDPERHRTLRVARLSGALQTPLPPLLDCTLVGTHGSGWVLTGFERVAAGPLQDTVLVGQTWLAEPAPEQDLLQAEDLNARLREELASLRAAAGLSAGSSPSPGPGTASPHAGPGSA